MTIYDLERPGEPVYSVKGHESIINAIDGVGGLNVGAGAPELVTGSRDGAVGRAHALGDALSSLFAPRIRRTAHPPPGCVKVWDPRVAEPVVSLEPGEGEAARDCWTVCFGARAPRVLGRRHGGSPPSPCAPLSFGPGNSYADDERVVVAGYDNGDVKMFDLRTNTMRWETNVGNGVRGAGGCVRARRHSEPTPSRRWSPSSSTGRTSR